jgi:uncharacterized membrane protein (DUF4010 family)
MTAFERLLVAILVGFLIGLDRERAEVRKAHKLFAGVRTFPLIALAGAVPMLLIDRVGPALLVASFVAVAAVAVVSYLRGSGAGDIGATTEIAALATFLIGALAGAGELVVAGAAGVAVAVLLVAKPRLEGFSRALTQQELAAVLELAVITVIVLPLVPNRGYGPWAVLNPFEIWLVVVLVSALSFAGFVAMRLLGEQRGMLLAGVVGALVSSTAVTVAMAAQSRAAQGLARLAAASAVLASAVMCVRVAVFAGAVNVAMLPRLLPVVLAMGLEGVAVAWLLGKDSGNVAPDSGPAAAKLSNPFSLTAAVTFALIYAVILLGVRAAQEYLGTGGLYVAAVLGSLADVDAVAIAFSHYGGGAMGWPAASAAVVVGMVTNTLVKLGVALAMGSRPFGRYVAGALGGMAVIGVLAGVLIARV